MTLPRSLVVVCGALLSFACGQGGGAIVEGSNVPEAAARAGVRAASVLGNAGNPGVLPPGSHAFGLSYGDWSARWWQWGLTLPVPGHPFAGCPASCAEGQSGPVWFLAGGPTDCSCTVPPGKALFFPLANAECSTLEPAPFHGDTEAEQRACAKGWADQIPAASLFCEIDGMPMEDLARYRFASPQFGFTASTPWIFGGVGGPGTAVGDGYYLLLRPLSKGRHTIHFGTTAFGIDTTYHVTVD